MFVSGEMSESKQKRVRIKEMDGWTLGMLIDYVYTAEIQVTEENVQVHNHTHSRHTHTFQTHTHTLFKVVLGQVCSVAIRALQVLLPAAGLLQLSDVKKACCEFLSSQLHPTNCLGIRAFADLHACTDLLTQANTYAGTWVWVWVCVLHII